MNLILLPFFNILSICIQSIGYILMNPNGTNNDYSKSIHAICITLLITIVLIVLFVVSPLKQMYWIAFFGKTVCIGLLLYVLYQNLMLRETVSAELGKQGSIYNYLFSLFVLILILSLLRKFFVSREVPVAI